MNGNPALDQIIQRLQNLEPFNIYSVLPDGSVQPWYEVTGAIVRDLIIREEALSTLVCAVSSQVMHWGRLVAQTKRVWEIEERNFRVWKARRTIELMERPEGEAGKEWKKPTEALIEAKYRVHPEYLTWCNRVERAEEAFNAATTILEAFKAQRDMLKSAVVRAHDQASPRLSV